MLLIPVTHSFLDIWTSFCFVLFASLTYQEFDEDFSLGSCGQTDMGQFNLAQELNVLEGG